MLLNVHDVDIKLLRVFQVVAKYKGITAAQSVLNSAQPTISMQLAQLEDRLGVVLCQRGQAGFKMTEEGSRVLEAAESLFNALDGFKLELSDLGNNPKGQLKFGVIDNLSTHPDFCLPAIISEYNEKVPNVKLQIVVETSAELEQMVMDGSLQFCIGVCERRLPSFNYTPLFVEKNSLYCSTKHEIASAEKLDMEEISRYQYVDWEYNEPRGVNSQDPEFKHGASTPYLEAILFLLASGNYIGYLPDHYAKYWLDKGVLKKLDVVNEERFMDIYIMTKKGIKLSSTVSIFVELLKENYKHES